MELERLRRLSQELLQRLRANQEALAARAQRRPRSPPARPPGAAAPRGRRADARPRAEETRGRIARADPEAAASVEGGPQAALLGLVPPTEPQRPSRTDRQHRSRPDSPEATRTGDPLAGCAGQPCAPVGGSRAPRERAEAELPPAVGLGRLEQDGPRTGQQAVGSGGAKASARMPPAPKSILLTPQSKGAREKGRKEAGRVTFLSDPKEHLVPAGGWSIRPFLGYDWIAGLLDMDSSVSEKSEEYFSELRDFRQLNRDACVSCGNSYLDELGASPRDPEPEVDTASHECVFCYRLNKRLFATPLDPETACPICKTARAQRWPETLVEPAFVRISIPRSTLLPAYKHRIHRRKSYEPADDLALSSHCLAGWEHPPRPRSPPLSSLDLRSCSGAGPSGQVRTPTGPCPEPGRAGASRAPEGPGGSARGAHVGLPVPETWLPSGRGRLDGPAAGPSGGVRTRDPLLAAETPQAPGEEAASD